MNIQLLALIDDKLVLTQMSLAKNPKLGASSKWKSEKLIAKNEYIKNVDARWSTNMHWSNAK